MPFCPSPHASQANVAVNMTNHNFGIQEWHLDHLGAEGEAAGAMAEVFSGMCSIKDGMAWPVVNVRSKDIGRVRVRGRRCRLAPRFCPACPTSKEGDTAWSVVRG